MNVLIASPDQQLKLALAFLLNTQPAIRLTGSVSTDDELVALAQISAPDVILLDGCLGEALTRLTALKLTAKLIVISNDDRPNPGRPVDVVLNRNNVSTQLLSYFTC